MSRKLLFTRLPEALFIVILLACFLTGCSNAPTDEDAKSLIETLEFGPEECGQFQLTGDIELGSNPLPFLKSKAHMNLDKQKPCPTP